MRNILRQLTFQIHLFFFLGDIIDWNLEARILEDDTFDDKRASVLVDGDGHSFLILTSRTLLPVLVDKMYDIFQFTDGENFLCRFQVGIRN